MKLETIIAKNAFQNEAYNCIYGCKVPCTLSSSSNQCGAQLCVRSFSSGYECLHIFIQVPAVFGNFCVVQSLQTGFRDVQIVSYLTKEQVKNYFGDGQSLKPAH